MRVNMGFGKCTSRTLGLLVGCVVVLLLSIGTV